MKRFLLVIILMNSNFVFAQTPQLLFESGFEPSTIATTSGFYKWGIKGNDSTSGYNWNTDLGALDFTRAGNMTGNNDNTFGVTDIAEIITDPDNENNRVLHFEQHSAPVGSARISAAMLFDWGVGYGGIDYFQQGYVRYRMKLSDGYTALPP